MIVRDSAVVDLVDVKLVRDLDRICISNMRYTKPVPNIRIPPVVIKLALSTLTTGNKVKTLRARQPATHTDVNGKYAFTKAVPYVVGHIAATIYKIVKIVR